MDDLALFIQSMSEKYGLLDSSHKQQQLVTSNHHVQDNSSSAASNNFNSEDCQGSSWECLSIFISGSQSIDCKTVPLGPKNLPSVGNPRNLVSPTSSLEQKQQNNGSPLHSFSKMIEIDEDQSSFGDTNVGIREKEEDLPHSEKYPKRESSSAVQSSEAERGTIYDSCGDLSSVVTMSDYVQQCYFHKDGQQREASFAPSASKNSGQVDHSYRTAVSNREDCRTVFGETQRAEWKEAVTSQVQEQDSKSSIEHTLGTNATASSSGLLQEQEARDRRRRVGVSAFVGADSEAESGQSHMSLHERDISSGRTRRATHTDLVPDCGQEPYKTEPRVELGKDSHFAGKSSGSFHTYSDGSQPFDVSQSFDSHGNKQERERRESLGGDLDYRTSNELTPDNLKENYGAPLPMTSEYLPISSAMQTRVEQLDEVSKELFAGQKDIQSSSKFNLTLESFDNEKFHHKSPPKTPMLRKPLGGRDFFGDETREQNVLIKKSNRAPPMRPSADLESKHPAASLMKPRNVAGNTRLLDDARFLETSWEQDGDLSFGGTSLGMEDCPAEVPGTCQSKWSYINKLLCDNGFSPLDLHIISASGEVAEKLFHTISDVIRYYAKRENVVQELLAERAALCQEELRNNELIQRLESSNDIMKRKLATSEQRAVLANAAAEKTCAALRKDNQRLEASHASMLQRCSQLEHSCRAKERALRKLQEKIQDAVEREERQRAKEKELYEKLKHKIAVGQKAQGEVIESNFLLRDLKPATIVGIYERQRTASEAEMNLLREENARLCRELLEMENCVLSKMQAMSISESNRIIGRDETEAALVQQLAEAVNQKEELRNGIVDLQVQLKSHIAEEQNASMPSLQRHQIDAVHERRSDHLLREVSRQQLEMNCCSALQTANVSGCIDPRCQECLQDICCRLKVSDPARINDAIDGLLKVVAAVPRMETFIEQVCDTVFNDGSMFLGREGALQTPEAVPGILKSWIIQLQSSEDLREFKESIVAQLWERFNEKAATKPMSSRVAAASVKDLIDTERLYFFSQESYREGEIVLKAEPQKLLHRVISHFQMLFEIPQLEGVMAVMNSVYIQISEYHNFARALCSMLGLPKDVGPNTIISTITSILNKVLDLS